MLNCGQVQQTHFINDTFIKSAHNQMMIQLHFPTLELINPETVLTYNFHISTFSKYY